LEPFYSWISTGEVIETIRLKDKQREEMARGEKFRPAGRGLFE
jgi:hypothetical protein